MDNNLEKRKASFEKVFLAVKRKYGKSTKRLAGEGWEEDWQLLFATMMSAQTKTRQQFLLQRNCLDIVDSLKKISSASEQEILKIIKKVNYNRTKAKISERLQRF
jgi:endonuclease III